MLLLDGDLCGRCPLRSGPVGSSCLLAPFTSPIGDEEAAGRDLVMAGPNIPNPLPNQLAFVSPVPPSAELAAEEGVPKRPVNFEKHLAASFYSRKQTWQGDCPFALPLGCCMDFDCANLAQRLQFFSTPPPFGRDAAWLEPSRRANNT